MDKSTENLLSNYIDAEKQFLEVKEKLYSRIKEVFTWENENLGKKNKITNNSNWICKEICVENGMVYVYVYETWAYGGYDKEEAAIDGYKLISDEWKEKALKDYQEKLKMEENLKKQKEKERLSQLEAKELAEYERLKAKYGK